MKLEFNQAKRLAALKTHQKGCVCVCVCVCVCEEGTKWWFGMPCRNVGILISVPIGEIVRAKLGRLVLTENSQQQGARHHNARVL